MPASFTWERNRSVPSSFQFLERTNRLFRREQNDCVPILLFCVQTRTQLFRSIFVPVSGTEKQAVQMETERLRTNFALCSNGNAIVRLTCSPFACSNGDGTERLRIVPLFVSII